MPQGSYHSVGTVNKKKQDFTPAILHGFFFDSRYTMTRTVGALIQCAHWHLQWTNIIYEDRFPLILRLAQWQLSKRRHDAPFTGGNLYALMFIMQYAAFLQPLQIPASPTGALKWLKTYQPNQKSPIVVALNSLVQELWGRLTATEHAECIAAFKDYIAYHRNSYTGLIMAHA